MKIPLADYLDLLAHPIKSHKGLFVLLAVLVLGSTALQIVNPQIMRRFIDAALEGETVERLIVTALAFVGIALFQQAVAVSATYVGENVAWNATNALRAELAGHCLHLDTGFHNNTSPGELIERIDGDVMELSNFFSQLVVRVIGNLVLMAGICVALVIEEGKPLYPKLGSLGFAGSLL